MTRRSSTPRWSTRAESGRDREAAEEPRDRARRGPAEESAEFEAGEVESELDEARRKAEEYRNDLLRLAADFDNYRKRVARDSESLAQRAGESIVSDLLPVLDNLERAVDASEHHEEAAVMEGVVPRPPAAGRPAAPARPARRSRPSRASRSTRTCTRPWASRPSEHPEGTIAAVWQRGYRLGDRILRAARVVVSSGPAAAEPSAAESED